MPPVLKVSPFTKTSSCLLKIPFILDLKFYQEFDFRMEYYNDSDDENIESVVDVSEKTAAETSNFILKRMKDIKSRSLLQVKTDANPHGDFNYEQDYLYWFAHVSGIQNFQENMKDCWGSIGSTLCIA